MLSDQQLIVDHQNSLSHYNPSVNPAGDFISYSPAQFCGAGVYNADAAAGLGNFAFLTGNVQDDAYVGGNIVLGSSTVSRGNVLAGNEFQSGGNTTVYGDITTQGGGQATYNTMGGSTTIEVDYLPPTFTPVEGTTLITGGNGGNCEGEDCGTGATVDVLWVRYL